jgi:diaminopimelate epimerase
MRRAVDLAVMSGAGNVFAVAVAEAGVPPDAKASLARDLCPAGAVIEGVRLDGLLVVSRAAGADCRMEVYNADGSRAEMCGNGLRCVALFARSRGLADADRVRVATDAGVREVELVREGRRIVGARAALGVPRVLAVDESIPLESGARSVVTIVDVGNPHCVLFVADVARADVARLGPALERHPRFPARTNVEFCELAQRRIRLRAWKPCIRLRVWERGVGETKACGTGACAAAVAASVAGGAKLPIEVELPGGRLQVDWDGRGEARVSGDCKELWCGKWPPRPARQR